MTRRSVRFRLLAAAAVSITLALAAAGLGLDALFEHHVRRHVESQLDDDLFQILSHIERAPDGRIEFDLVLADPRFERPLSGLYWQIQDEDRPTLLRSRSLWDTTLDLPTDVLPAGALHRHELRGPGDETLLVLERRVVFHPDTEQHHLRVAVALDRQELVEAGRAFATDMLPYLLGLGAILMIAAWVQVRVGLAPLDAVRLGVRSIRRGDARRLPAEFPDEVTPLVEEVNALLDAQDGAIERARAWTADLAHGLKTPLVVLAADAERLRAVGQTELADDLDSLAQTMRQRVDRELIRARIRARAPTPADAQRATGDLQGTRGEADLAGVINQVVRTLQRTPAGARLDWRLDGPEALPVRMLPEDLAELLGNVLENAATWARNRVSIRLTAAEPVVVRVEDDGPGVPEEALQALAQRGLRLDERTQGYGLGLAIAQDICDAYGAVLSFAVGAPGADPTPAGTAMEPMAEPSGTLGGLVVTLRLPGAPRIRPRPSRGRPVR